jgi:hypothetical protein
MDTCIVVCVIDMLHMPYLGLHNAALQCLASCIGLNAGLGCAKRGLQDALLEMPEKSVPCYAGLKWPSAGFPSPSSNATAKPPPQQSSTPRSTTVDPRGGARPNLASGALGSASTGSQAGE